MLVRGKTHIGPTAGAACSKWRDSTATARRTPPPSGREFLRWLAPGQGKTTESHSSRSEAAAAAPDRTKVAKSPLSTPGWTAVTKDGQPSAQFEHTMLINETGVEVLTARLPTSPPLWWEAEGMPLRAP